ncbi:LacI family DNA-binding transcriptional regulator [Erythrobacter sp. F6033]|uniref:LacI family DNA-binding transcriptional regulator n=1 Tax=Erythrobacter sp. F6033 TaxID=2926401 RepID=UPI001FF24504|nr:LacI family DNA-binding transcriptional regulator [Erythrobacter sp. F6033]MCK0127624.1 LacI family DNA-binding transcriptional regulator [Erythrobacter sp. F6033]
MTRTRRRTTQAVKIDDVARQAGVSAMTVSRVMNRESGVRPGTREKVLKAVEALNYQPNRSARRLAKGGEVHIGLIYANPSDSYLGRFLHGALGAAQRTDNHLIVDICDEDRPASYVSSALRLAKANIAGVILPPPISGSDEILSVFNELQIPVATVANGNKAMTFRDIRIDDEEAAARMTRHLIDLDHKNIGFIQGKPDQASSLLRERGFRREMEIAGLRVDPDYIAPGQFTYRSGVEAAAQLLGLDKPPTAIFASNDDMAAATIGVAHRKGLIVPDDLSVVGFDNSPSAISVWPELTTIDQPVSAMAAAAFELVLKQIHEPADAEEIESAEAPLDCELIVRGSCGPSKE